MLEVVILAAGEGRRMRSSRPKVLQPVGGQPMLAHLVDSVRALKPDALHVVIGAGAEQVRAAFPDEGIQWVEQAERLGTGHALAQALPQADPDARILVLPGDMPLIRPGTLEQLLQAQADLAVLGFKAADPTGYGRIIRAGERVLAIREERDASEQERAIKEVNSGVMWARARDFSAWLQRIDRNNVQGEYYLTDCVAIAAADQGQVAAVVSEDAAELLGANDRAQLAALERVHQQRARLALMAAGAILADPERVQIRGHVEVGKDVFIDAGVVLEGDNRLGDGVVLGTGSVLRNCELAAGTRVEPYSVLEQMRSTGACSIGPFARLRPGSRLDEGVKVGNFVEIKNAWLHAGAKASHLSYIGDAEVGAGANLGAGTITCNYDGVNKHRTVIGEQAFIGSNSALVAPVTIGAEATIGAGSVVSGQAPAGQLTLSRAPQRTISGWKRPQKKEG